MVRPRMGRARRIFRFAQQAIDIGDTDRRNDEDDMDDGLPHHASLRVSRRAADIAEIARLDVASILASVREAKLHSFRERGGEIVLEVTGPLVAYGNAEAVETILANLVDNALKYSTEKPRVTLSARREDRRLLVDVKDNGIGLSRQEVVRVFHKFYRAPGGEERHAKGSGLGLFIARGLAESFGGRLRATSEGPGKGSTFTLSLPL